MNIHLRHVGLGALVALAAACGEADPGTTESAALALAATASPSPCTSWNITHYCPQPSEGGCLDAQGNPVCTTEDVRNHTSATCDGKTRSCTQVTVACDPAVMALGTCFTIPGSTFTYCCTDTGSAVHGCHLDVAIDCDAYGNYDNHSVTIQIVTSTTAS